MLIGSRGVKFSFGVLWLMVWASGPSEILPDVGFWGLSASQEDVVKSVAASQRSGKTMPEIFRRDVIKCVM